MHTLFVGISTLFFIYCVKTTRQEVLEFDNILPDNPLDYDNLQPPKDNGEPTVVRFHVWVLNLDSIDEGSMTYVADIFMSQSWKDYRLRLPENMSSYYRLLPVSWLKRMWRPDSFFKNAKKVTFQEMTIPNHYIWLYDDKTILYMVKLTLILSCAMTFETYPHDTQICTMKIESLSYTTDDLVFDWEPETPLVVEDSIELPQHILIDKRLGYCTQVYSTGNFTCIQVSFKLKRRLGYYMFHTYIPTCLIVIVSWISFWIRPEAVPARVTLCVTSLLTLSTQHAQSQKSLPPVSYIKAIDIFMSSCTVFVFASLMEYALVSILLGEYNDQAGKRSLQNMLLTAKGAEDVIVAKGKRPKTLASSAQRRKERANLMDKISRVAFPLSFIFLNSVYLFVFIFMDPD
ncbi:glycine receptor subunit alpha-2-like isoform X1 [Tachypleus tridentatus]|uniref:glycine receptor subunit alpha-2-like isoform X1 n=2 Tax=Tachypleus tridentatus TaxID=6853 RepID=UPI003FD37A31